MLSPFDAWDRWEAAGWVRVEGSTPTTFGRCRSCGAEMLWVVTRNGRHAPYDRDGKSHFASCPEAKAWRKR
jgi:hypothetical protein